MHAALLPLVPILALCAACAPPPASARPAAAEPAWTAVPTVVLPVPGGDRWRPLAWAQPPAWRVERSGGALPVRIAPAADGGLDWAFAFPGTGALEYAELRCDLPLPPDCAAVAWGMAMAMAMSKAEREAQAWPLVMRARVSDASGEIHQYTVGHQGFDAGRPLLAVLRDADGRWAAAGAVWGGDGNRRLDPPLRLHSLIADRPVRGVTGAYAGRLAAPVALARRPLPPPPAFALAVRGAGPGAQVALGADLALQARCPAGSLAWRIGDLAGRELAAGAAAEVRPPTDRPGWFEVVFSVREGAAVARHAYRYLVLPPSAVRNPWTGVCTHFVQAGRPGRAWTVDGLGLVPGLGFSAIRDEIPWALAEPVAGALAIPERAGHDPARPDWFVARARALGLDPLLILCYGHPAFPAWPTTPEARAAFAGYAARLAAAQPDATAFEVWNEWSFATGVPGGQRDGRNTPDAYVELLRAVAPAVRAARPDALVVGAGGENPRELPAAWDGMLAAGLATAAPVHSVHPYRFDSPPEAAPGLVEEVEGYAAQLRARGGSGRLWVSEVGWTSTPEGTGTDEAGQARCTLRALALLRSVPAVERVFLYDLVDDGRLAGEKEHHFGLLHHPAEGLMPKPVAGVVAAFNRLTADCGVAARAQQGARWSVAWTTPAGDDLILVWSAGAAQPLAVAGTVVEVLDAAGTPLAALPAEVDGWPVYLRGRGLRLR